MVRKGSMRHFARCLVAFDAISGRIASVGGLRVEMTRQLDPSADHVRAAPVIHIIDDDKAVREAVGDLLRSMGYSAVEYRSASEFLDAKPVDSAGCIVLDVRLPGTSGLELQDFLARSGNHLPVILMTGFGDIQMSVRGMKAGAVDFLTKPFRDQDMLDAVSAALDRDAKARQGRLEIDELRAARATLKERERQVMDLVVSGQLNKQIAGELGLSEVTIKVTRAAVMRKMGARSIAELARMAAKMDEQ